MLETTDISTLDGAYADGALDKICKDFFLLPPNGIMLQQVMFSFNSFARHCCSQNKISTASKTGKNLM